MSIQPWVVPGTGTSAVCQPWTPAGVRSAQGDDLDLLSQAGGREQGPYHPLIVVIARGTGEPKHRFQGAGEPTHRFRRPDDLVHGIFRRRIQRDPPDLVDAVLVLTAGAYPLSDSVEKPRI